MQSVPNAKHYKLPAYQLSMHVTVAILPKIQTCQITKHQGASKPDSILSILHACQITKYVKSKHTAMKTCQGQTFQLHKTKMQTFSPSIPADMWNAHKPAPMLCPSVLRHAMLRYVPLGWGCWLYSYTAIASLASPILPPLLLSCCPLSTCVAGHSWSQCHSYKALWSLKDTLISIAQNSLVPCIVYTDQCCQKHLHSLLLKSPNDSI